MTLIYVSLFVFLNIIAMFDLFFGNVKGFEKFANFLSKFYYIFSLVDKILGFVIFTGLIYYLESGHHNKIARVMDYFVRSFYGIIGMSLCEKLILIFVGIPLFGGLLAILIIFRDHFGLKYNPLDYIGIIMDCYSIFEIYTNVGFFLVLYFVDLRRQTKEKLVERFYRYSIIKIIRKTEKYAKIIIDAREELNNAFPKYEKTDPSYYYFLKKIYDKFIQEGNTSNSNTNMNMPIDLNANINVNTNMNIPIDLNANNNANNDINKTIDGNTKNNCNEIVLIIINFLII
jgi:hypothetical protein